ncbi:hypothetical protein [Roseobacter sp.]|uniref:hypothetical protein n=1 Tax=Roseobacter sp. TaxID=1907202 RepID=UPI0029663F5C|nr:hypothetical protein [Roseobacter sp.]
MLANFDARKQKIAWVAGSISARSALENDVFSFLVQIHPRLFCSLKVNALQGTDLATQVAPANFNEMAARAESLPENTYWRKVEPKLGREAVIRCSFINQVKQVKS